ncbi:Uncharacterised protein [Vibrio cholerae]|nr:Uncharacterised protein [Vibrio cholerae]
MAQDPLQSRFGLWCGVSVCKADRDLQGGFCCRHLKSPAPAQG